jgi:hypothetical protein
MKTLRSLAVVAAASASLVAASTAPAASPPHHAALVIHHQEHGCHAWSVNGGASRASQTLWLRHDGWLTVTDDDLMPHLLVQTGGPAKASIVHVRSAMHDMETHMHGPGLMAHMGAAVKVEFHHPGTYRFTTKAGEDYMDGVRTVGPDNVLHLTVHVD